MNSLLFLCVGAGVLVLAAVKSNAKLHNALKRHSSASWYLPQAISMLIITAQVSELVKIVEHVSIVNVAAAMLLLAIMVATKSGTEGEPR